MKKPGIAVLGAGSWGTAMAIHLAKGGYPVQLWTHRKAHAQMMNQEKMNRQYMPDVPFPSNLTANADLNSAIASSDEVLIAVPSHAFREVIQEIDAPLSRLAWLSKGIDHQSHDLLSHLAEAKFGEDLALCYIAGPSFAKEVAASLPTAINVVSNNPDFQNTWLELLHHDNLRPYLARDIVGAQICGAVKNVMAIACGISDGLGYGANARAALITRGLAEMKRLGLALGAKEKTFAGLTGLGDLVLTCTDNQSRNRRFGLLLGQGHAIDKAEREIAQVVEGKFNAAQVCSLAASYQIDMPICQQVLAILEGKTTVRDATNHLMERPLHEE